MKNKEPQPPKNHRLNTSSVPYPAIVGTGLTLAALLMVLLCLLCLWTGTLAGGVVRHGVVPLLIVLQALAFLGVVFLVIRSVRMRQVEGQLRRRALRERQQRLYLENLLNYSQVCIGVLENQDLRFTAANRACQALCPQMDILGHRFADVFPEAAASGAQTHLRKALVAARPCCLRGCHMPIAGRPDAFWDLKVEHLPAIDGEAASILLVAWDVTEHKQAEQSLRESQLQYRTFAEKRTKQLQALAIELLETEERQRQRIAHLLQEDLQQILVAARFELHNYTLNSPRPPQLEHIGQLLDESIQKSNQLSQDLSPSWLNHIDLISALEWLVRQMNQKYGLEIKVEVSPEIKVENIALKLFIYRAIQEFVHNVRKHSGSLSARISVTCSDGHLIIKISDKGKGFDPNLIGVAPEDKGFGLLRLRERANYIGGSLVIKSTAGHGSVFTLTVPLNLTNSA
jgi:signal transduction histidine kinase